MKKRITICSILALLVTTLSTSLDNIRAGGGGNAPIVKFNLIAGGGGAKFQSKCINTNRKITATFSVIGGAEGNLSGDGDIKGAGANFKVLV